METAPVISLLPLTGVAKVALWLGIFVLMLHLCPEALAVALQPPLLKCFPPGRQALILAHLAGIAMASVLLLS